MDDPISQGFPFDVKALWRESPYMFDDDYGNLFSRLSTDLQQLELGDEATKHQNDLYIPELDVHDEPQLQGIEGKISSPITVSEFSGDTLPEPATDIWDLEFEIDDHNAAHPLYTWESFQKVDAPNSQKTAYLSEAGPKAFDAALVHLEKEPTRDGVLPQDVLLSAHFNLALGRSSIFFQWDATKKTFVPTLPGVPISGLSLAASNSFTDDIIALGSLYRTTIEFASLRTPNRLSCTATIAFKGCITGILDGLEQHISSGFPRVFSLLQLRQLTDGPYELLRIVWDLVRSIKGCANDEEIISRLSDRIHQIVSAENRFGGILRLVLTTTARPWLERLCIELGIIDGRLGRPAAESAELDASADNDLSGSLDTAPFDAEGFLTFASIEDRALIRQTKRSIKVLRQHLPDYQLVRTTSGDTSYITYNASGEEELDVKSVLGETIQAQHFIDSVFTSQNQHRVDDFTTSINSTEDRIWTNDCMQHENLAAVDARISQPIEAPSETSNPLQVSVTDTLRDGAAHPVSLDLSEDMTYNPLQHLRPLIHDQLATVNAALLRHVFFDLRLRHHLNIQKQYHLLGNGDFLARLSTALFSAETRSAERKRGAVPTEETMGLRLGARGGQRWPPASSELQLTLMDVLKETYTSDTLRKSKSAKELPGGLSFSIRELPDEDIDKVLDSGSIYALDFLRLQYTAPPCLDEIFTPSAMNTYDGIFKFLLRLLRVLHTTTRLKVGAAADKTPPDGEIAGSEMRTQFAFESHRFMSILMSHYMDIGIEAPWQKFTASTADIELALNIDGAASGTGQVAMGLKGLRALHEEFLERLRNRLFLRRKQEKIKKAIENVLVAILKGASGFESEQPINTDVHLAPFRDSIAELTRALSVTVNKPAKITSISDATESDAEATGILLKRLETSVVQDIL